MRTINLFYYIYTDYEQCDLLHKNVRQKTLEIIIVQANTFTVCCIRSRPSLNSLSTVSTNARTMLMQTDVKRIRK